MNNQDTGTTPPIVSFVGKSNSGKTTFLEKLIPEMKRRGYRLGVIKHDAHSFTIDHEGKDSYRLKEAGADTVILSSETKLALVKDVGTTPSLHELCNKFLLDVDIIFSEGYSKENAHKIEISRCANSTELIFQNDECIAIISDWTPETCLPVYNLNDVEKVGDFIQENILARQDSENKSDE